MAVAQRPTPPTLNIPFDAAPTSAASLRRRRAAPSLPPTPPVDPAWNDLNCVGGGGGGVVVVANGVASGGADYNDLTLLQPPSKADLYAGKAVPLATPTTPTTPKTLTTTTPPTPPTCTTPRNAAATVAEATPPPSPVLANGVLKLEGIDFVIKIRNQMMIEENI